MKEPEEMLTVTQAADRMGISVRSVRRMMEQRHLRFVRWGRLIRVPASAIEEAKQAGMVEAVADRDWAA